MRIKTLRSTRRISGVRRLVVRHEVACIGAGVVTTASMAPRLSANAIDICALTRAKVATGPSRGDRLTCIGTKPNTNSGEFVKASLRLPRLSLGSRNLAFNGFCQARGRTPTGVEFLHSLYGRFGPCLSNGEPSFLRRCGLGELTVSEPDLPGSPPCARQVLGNLRRATSTPRSTPRRWDCQEERAAGWDRSRP